MMPLNTAIKTLVALFFIALLSQHASAGKLRDFEKAATGKDTSRRSSSESGSSDNSSNSNSNNNNNSNNNRSNNNRSNNNRSNNNRTNNSSNRGRGGSAQNSRNDYYDDHYYERRRRHRGPRGIGYRRYCRRNTLFDGIFYPHNLHHSRDPFCRPSTSVIVIHDRDNETSKTDQVIEEAATTTTRPPIESLHVSRMLEPSIQLRFNVGELESVLELRDFQIDLGYRNIGLNIQQSDLIEEGIDKDEVYEERIKITKAFLAYRMRLGGNFALKTGIGPYKLKGMFATSEISETSETSAAAVQFVGKWHHNMGFGGEVVITNTLGGALDIEENEFNLFYGYDHFSAKIGYRILQVTKEGPTQRLDGFTFGLSLNF